MLTLARRNGESIRIGDDITITITDSRSNLVRLSIDAPKDISIHREEIYLTIQSEAQVPSSDAESEGPIIKYRARKGVQKAG